MAVEQDWGQRQAGHYGVPQDGFAVTPSDTEDLDVYPVRALWVGTLGTLTVEFWGDGNKDTGNIVTFVNVQGYFWGVIRKVLDTDTTATDIVGLP